MTRWVETQRGRPRVRISSQKERIMRRRRDMECGDSGGVIFFVGRVRAETAVVGGIVVVSRGAVSAIGGVLFVASCD